METSPQPDSARAMNLAERLRKLRDDKEMSLDDVAKKAKISKTYLWELERDEKGAKKPSADVLLRIAEALKVSLAELLALATVQVKDGPVEVPPSLCEFQERMDKQGEALTADDLRDLATTKFRGHQPQSADEWHQLYLLLAKSQRRRKS